MVGHIDLSERIIECMYEVTDRLTYYVCSRKPSHRGDEHLIISDLASNLEKNDITLEGKSRLQMVHKNSYWDYFPDLFIYLIYYVM